MADNRRTNRRPFDPPVAAAPVQRGDRPWPEVHYLPGETGSEVFAEFAYWFQEVETAGRSGRGRDHSRAQAAEIRQTAEMVMRHLMHLGYGSGEDILRVSGKQARACVECIRERRHVDDDQRPLMQLSRPERARHHLLKEPAEVETT